MEHLPAASLGLATLDAVAIIGVAVHFSKRMNGIDEEIKSLASKVSDTPSSDRGVSERGTENKSDILTRIYQQQREFQLRLTDLERKLTFLLGKGEVNSARESLIIDKPSMEKSDPYEVLLAQKISANKRERESPVPVIQGEEGSDDFNISKFEQSDDDIELVLEQLRNQI